MITLRNVKTLNDEIRDIEIKSQESQIIDAKGLTIMPALIDPHVHFSVPGETFKEDWITGSQAAIAGGVTTVFDMPDNVPACNTKARLEHKFNAIEKQLEQSGIPLRYHLFFGADKNHLEELAPARKKSVGIKIYLAREAADLQMNDEEALHFVFRLAAQQNIIVAVQAEDENIIQENRHRYDHEDFINHAKIYDRKSVVKATARSIKLAQNYGTQLYLSQVSTLDEIHMIREAKANEVLVYAEAAVNYLFFTEEDLAKSGSRMLADPPYRTRDDQQALWKAIEDGTIDTLTSHHTPCSLAEKDKPYGECPAGSPGIETFLPLLLNAYHENKISLGKIIDLTRKNAIEIFRLPYNEDVILVDLEKTKTVEENNLKTKNKWSPFAGVSSKGWPIYTIINGKIFDCR